MPDGQGMLTSVIAGFGVALLVGLFGSAATSAGLGIAGSPHDLSGRGADGATEICAFCHVSEKAGTANPPLWIRGDLVPGDFTAYGNPGGGPAATQTYGISMVCLSCHDAVIAPDVVVTAVSALGRSGSVPAEAGDFAASHPVSVLYNGRYDPAFKRPIGGRVGELPLFGVSGAGGAGDRVECPSCHNPHEIVFGKFLRISNSDSALCRNCHDK